MYCMMRAVQKFCPIFTLCVGNAFGEAALLLAAGSKVRRAGAPPRPTAHLRRPAAAPWSWRLAACSMARSRAPAGDGAYHPRPPCPPPGFPVPTPRNSPRPHAPRPAARARRRASAPRCGRAP